MQKWWIGLLVATAVAVAWYVHPGAVAPAAAGVVRQPVGERTTLPHASPTPARVVVYVVGAVARRGVYTLKSGARRIDAVRAAGDITGSADARAVNLAAPLVDGEEIEVPAVGEPPRCPAVAPAAGTKGAHRGKKRAVPDGPAWPAPAAAPERTPPPVDLNRADAGALAELPGIGPALAARIVAFRALNGPFASIDDLADVAGMTQRRVDALAPLVVVR